jgi:multidrug efflux pump subunit AcrA (membrane-fusion protein)
MLTILKATARDILWYFWPLSKRANLYRSGAAALLILVLTVLSVRTNGTSEDTTETNLPTVQVATVADVTGGAGPSFIGTVRAVNEAAITTETAGRVTRVNVAAGDTVAAGAILVTLENASEQAAVLQARGAYEAAEAAAAQSEVGVGSASVRLTAAENAALSAYRNAYTTVNGVVLSTIDQFYGDPQSFVPGVRIEAPQVSFLNQQRVALQTILPNWQANTNTLTATGGVLGSLKEAEADTNTVIAIVDALLSGVEAAAASDTLDGQPVSSYSTSLTSARSTLNNTLTSLQSAATSLESAREDLRQAEIAGSENQETSAARAQVTQALGALRAAEANLAKTILRSPITGTVNSLSVNTGDFVSSFTQVAEIASNDALEIAIFVGEDDARALSVGDAARIDDQFDGTVTSVAPALDPATLKTEVKIATVSDQLLNGDTVRVRLEAPVVTNGPLMVPLTAVKFTATAGTMFAVTDATLESFPVSIGAVRGDMVTVTSGLTATTTFVIDARGRIAGQAVEPIPFQSSTR